MRNTSENDKLFLEFKLNSEGLEGTFISYGGDWEEINDKQFHILRKAYVDAHDALKQYLEKNGFITEY